MEGLDLMGVVEGTEGKKERVRGKGRKEKKAVLRGLLYKLMSSLRLSQVHHLIQQPP